MAGFLSFQVVSFLFVPAASYILYSQWAYRKRSKGLSLPPGPKGWPVIGNVFDVPLAGTALVYAQWAKSFGSDIVSAKVLGDTIVVIDSYDTAIELLEKRASKYSSRPRLVMSCEVLGWDCIFAFNPYSEMWRERRRLFVKYFRSPGHSDAASGTAAHTAQVYEFVNRFLLDVSGTSGDAYELVRRMIGSLAISLAYGLPVQRKGDELVEFVDSVARLFLHFLTPGNAIVDVIPSLNYIPESIPIPFTNIGIPVPGMGWKRYGKSVQWMAVKFKMEGYERAVKGFGTESVRPSFTSYSLASLDATSPTEEARLKGVDAIQDAAATIFGTAADTTTSAVLTHIYALATHPDIRKRIQAELDSVLVEEDTFGKRALRLPTLEDQDKLPILMAAVMESQRWVPVSPIGVPHRTTEDDVYKGHFIPKGSVVIANLWSMLNNKEEYGEDVLEFNPDRFIRRKTGSEGAGLEINPDIRHPATIAFGFGRRICPGSHIAQSTLWITAASLLTLFDFELPTGERANYVGSDGKVDRRFDPGFLCRPKELKCEFKVRSEEARALLAELAISV